MEKLEKIEEIYAKKNEFVDVTIPVDLSNELKTKNLNEISLKHMVSIKNKIEEISKTHRDDLAKLHPSTQSSQVPPPPSNPSSFGGFIRKMSNW